MHAEGHSQSKYDAQRSLDQDQAMGDLDQSIANREQVIVDREQHSINHAQDQLDGELAASDPSDLGSSAHLAHRQTQMEGRQARINARQEQTDRSQLGADDLQGLLDRQQHDLEQPVNSKPLNPEQLESAAAARIQATVQRAANERARAQDALRRADEAERRARALQQRQGQDGAGR